MNGRVVGGTLQAKALTSKLEPAVYAAARAQYWLLMLQDKMIPKKWHRATRNGTRIEFLYPQSQEEFDAAVERLKEYIDEANRLYDLGLVLGEAKEANA